MKNRKIATLGQQVVNSVRAGRVVCGKVCESGVLGEVVDDWAAKVCLAEQVKPQTLTKLLCSNIK